MPSPANFPLRWESTGDQWWYASPIDYAAANGLYDLVSELLHLDANLLIKLTSLRRLRRLESLWEDDVIMYNHADVAKCRASVAKRLLYECQKGPDNNSLIRAGYGGWLIYTAAAAGDVAFVNELLQIDPLLVFGEGEYGVSDMFYAAARSGNVEVFKVVMEFSIGRGNVDERRKEDFRWEMMNRAVHAAARGGSVEILRQLVEECGDVLEYRDAKGCSVLHSASARGQVEVRCLVFH